MRLPFRPYNPDDPTSIKSVSDSLIKGFSFNARSIMNKLSELSAFISTYDPDCIGISETWLSEDNT